VNEGLPVFSIEPRGSRVLFLFLKKNIKAPTRISKTTPPTTPPAMAPVLLFPGDDDDDDDGADPGGAEPLAGIAELTPPDDPSVPLSEPPDPVDCEVDDGAGTRETWVSAPTSGGPVGETPNGGVGLTVCATTMVVDSTP